MCHTCHTSGHTRGRTIAQAASAIQHMYRIPIHLCLSLLDDLRAYFIALFILCSSPSTLQPLLALAASPFAFTASLLALATSLLAFIALLSLSHFPCTSCYDLASPQAMRTRSVVHFSLFFNPNPGLAFIQG